MTQFLTYSKFFSLAEARPLIDILESERIPYQVEEEVNQLDPIYLGQNQDPMIVVRIRQESFRKVNDLLLKDAEANIEFPDHEHYLNDFSNEELQNVLSNSEEWNVYDRVFAKKLLAARNVSAPAAASKPDTPPYTPVRLQTGWIIAGYFFSVFSLLGLFMSLSLLNSHKTLHNGTRVKMYDRFTLKHAGTMLLISLVSTAILVLAKILSRLRYES